MIGELPLSVSQAADRLARFVSRSSVDRCTNCTCILAHPHVNRYNPVSLAHRNGDQCTLNPLTMSATGRFAGADLTSSARAASAMPHFNWSHSGSPPSSFPRPDPTLNGPRSVRTTSSASETPCTGATTQRSRDRIAGTTGSCRFGNPRVPRFLVCLSQCNNSRCMVL